MEWSRCILIEDARTAPQEHSSKGPHSRRCKRNRIARYLPNLALAYQQQRLQPLQLHSHFGVFVPCLINPDNRVPVAFVSGKGVQISGYWCYYQLLCQSLVVAYSCPLILLDSTELKPTTILSAGKDAEIWQSQCQDKERVQKCPRNGGLSRLAINLNAEGGIDPTSPPSATTAGRCRARCT